MARNEFSPRDLLTPSSFDFDPSWIGGADPYAPIEDQSIDSSGEEFDETTRQDDEGVINYPKTEV